MSINFKEIHYALHPWEFLQDRLTAAQITQKEFGKRVWKTQAEINQLVKWRRDITVDRAIRLAQFFGTSWEVWIGIQNSYDAYKLKSKDEEFYRSIRKRNHDTRTKRGSWDFS